MARNKAPHTRRHDQRFQNNRATFIADSLIEQFEQRDERFGIEDGV